MTASAPSLVDWPSTGPRRSTPSTDRPAALDVAARLGDLRAIARRSPWWRRCLVAGWDEEDLDQELAVRLQHRQRPVREFRGRHEYSASRYDPRRSSVGKYLYTFVRSNLLQLWQKAQRARAQREREQADPEPWASWGDRADMEDDVIDGLDNEWRG